MAGHFTPSCWSLLAGDAERTPTDHALNRLPHGRLGALSLSNGQAGSYIPIKPRVIATVLIALLFAGCTTTPAPVATAAPIAPIPPAAPVVLPPAAPMAPSAPVEAAKPATLTGSEESSTMFDNFTAFVVKVDGQAVAAGRQGWNTPLSLPPGPHRLRVAFNRGVFAAEAELSFSAYPGAIYQLKFATDAEVFGKNSYCEFWITDTATGEAVTPPRRVALTRIVPAK